MQGGFFDVLARLSWATGSGNVYRRGGILKVYSVWVPGPAACQGILEGSMYVVNSAGMRARLSTSRGSGLGPEACGVVEFVVADEFHADHAGPDVYLLLAPGAGEVVREPRGVPLRARAHSVCSSSFYNLDKLYALPNRCSAKIVKLI